MRIINNESFPCQFITAIFIIFTACSQNIPSRIPSLPATEKPTPAPTNTHLHIPTATTGKSIITPLNISRLEKTRDYSIENAFYFTWLKDNRRMAVARPDEIIMIRIGGDGNINMEQIISSSGIQSLIYRNTAEGGLLVWHGVDNFIHVWSLREEAEILRHDPQIGEITGVAVDKNGEWIAYSSIDNYVAILDIYQNEIISEWTLENWVTDLSFSPDNKWIAGVEKGNFTLRFIAVDSGGSSRHLDWVNHASPALYLSVLSPDWKLVAWVARSVVQLSESASGELGPIFAHEDYVNDLAWSPRSTIIATAAAGLFEGSYQPNVYLWEVASHKLLRVLPFDSVVREVMFSFDGTELAMLDEDGYIHLFNIIP